MCERKKRGRVENMSRAVVTLYIIGIEVFLVFFSSCSSLAYS